MTLCLVNILLFKEERKMFKKSKNFMSIIILMLLIISVAPTSVFAYNSNAWSVGSRYGDGYIFGLIGGVDTREEAKNAADYYATLGYNSYYEFEPTYQTLRGKFKNGSYRMESAIQFYSGHADYSCIAYNANKKGGDYKTGIYYGKNYDSDAGYRYAGVQSYDFSDVKLITFAGCNSAEGYDNICKRAYDNGAETTIGWKESVGSGSHTNWLNRFNDYLNKGYTVKKSAEHADSYSYLDNTVKAHKIYGNGDLKFSKLRTASLDSLLENDREPLYKFEYTSDSQIFQKLNQNASNFDIKNYDISETVNEMYRVIDLVEIVDGIKSTEGYSIIIYDGTADVYQNSASMDFSTIVHTENIESYLKNYCMENKSTIRTNKIETFTGKETIYILKEEEIYDTVENTIKKYYQIESTLANGCKAIIEAYE